MPVAAGATASPAQEDVEPPAAVPPVVSLCTAPDRYRHWRVAVDGQVATVTLTVDENGALVAGYELKMNSYDLGVDIELYDLVQRLRFEHPSVKSVVMTGGLERMFCAGANIRMLAQSSHAWKVNFCKFTNETRNGIEDATASSGQTWIAALNGTAAGGGYELALACEQIVLIDDGSSVVSLPEVSMLGVLPGTGGLTRVVDKRHVRKDRADLFATKPEGYRGQTAVQWGLVDATVARHGFADEITRRATEAAATSTRPSDAQGVQLTRLTRQDCGDEITYPYVTAKIAIDLAPEVGHFVLAGAGALPALSTASARVGRTSLLWGERARARTARWPAPTRMPVRCGSTPRAPRVRPRVRCTDTPTSGTSARPTASRCWGSGRRTCACRWPSSSSLTAWATRRGSRSPRERPRSWNHVTRRLRSSPGG